MPVIIALCVIAGLIAFAWVSVINARTLRRDLTRRVDAIQARLEHDANALVDLLESDDRR